MCLYFGLGFVVYLIQGKFTVEMYISECSYLKNAILTQNSGEQMELVILQQLVTKDFLFSCFK